MGKGNHQKGIASLWRRNWRLRSLETLLEECRQYKYIKRAYGRVENHGKHWRGVRDTVAKTRLEQTIE